MENHRRNLERLCRICGKKVTFGKGYWNAKAVGDYEDVMLHYFFFVVVTDLIERYIEEGFIIGIGKQE